MQEDEEVGRAPDRVEREPLMAKLHATQGRLEAVVLKYPLSQRSQAVEPSKENPAAHAQVPSARAAKRGAQVHAVEADGADLPIGQAVHLSALVALNLPGSQSPQLDLSAFEYVPGPHAAHVVEARVEEVPGSQLTQARYVSARWVIEYLPDSQRVQAEAPALAMYSPIVQLEQTAVPFLLANVPAWHGEHSWAWGAE